MVNMTKEKWISTEYIFTHFTRIDPETSRETAATKLLGFHNLRD